MLSHFQGDTLQRLPTEAPCFSHGLEDLLAGEPPTNLDRSARAQKPSSASLGLVWCPNKACGLRTKHRRADVRYRMCAFWLDRDSEDILQGMNLHDFMAWGEAQDPVLEYPEDFYLVCRCAVMIRGLALAFGVRMSTAEYWKAHAEAFLRDQAPQRVFGCVRGRVLLGGRYARQASAPPDIGAPDIGHLSRKMRFIADVEPRRGPGGWNCARSHSRRAWRPALPPPASVGRGCS